MARKPRESAHDLWKDEPTFTGLTGEDLETAQRMWRPMAEACEPRVRATVKEEERKLAWWQTALIGLGVTLIAGGVSALVGMVVVSSQADGVQNGKIEVNAEDREDRVHRQVQNPYAYPGPMSAEP